MEMKSLLMQLKEGLTSSFLMKKFKKKKSWVNPKPYKERGVLAKYAKVVSSASLGAVTD